MKKFIISLALGGAAGVIDCVPMLLQKLDANSIASAFIQWLVLGVVICYTVCRLPGWLKGALLAVAAAVPVMLLAVKTDIAAVIPMAIMSLVLGAAVGFFSSRLNPVQKAEC